MCRQPGAASQAARFPVLWAGDVFLKVDQMANAQFTLATKLQQLRTAEALLLRGATVPQLMGACGVSDRQIRRYFDLFRELGCPVASDAQPGQTEPAVFRIAKGDAVFRHQKG